MDEQKIPGFFLSANAPSGFYSRFDSMYDPNSDWHCIILKGGPGSGKSTLLRKAATRALAVDQKVELIYCSSDPKSLDAVILPEQHKCIADGTAPHILEPRYPGACETLFNPGDYWDSNFLYAHRDEIRTLNKKIAAHHRRAAEIRNCTVQLMDEARNIESEFVDHDRISRYADRLCSRIFRKVPKGICNESSRFLSGVTPVGLMLLEHTLPCYASHIAFLQDETGAVAPKILCRIRDAARKHQCRVICCYSPFHPEELEAVILPDQSEAYAITNRWLHYSFAPERTIHTLRFINTTVRSAHRSTVRFRLKSAGLLLEEVYTHLQAALHLHDELEMIYKSAMNYEQLDADSEKLLTEFIQ